LAVIATLSKGCDLDYIWKQVDGSLAKEGAGYYIQASETGGEPPGRWWGPGALALGLQSTAGLGQPLPEPGSQATVDLLLAALDPDRRAAFVLTQLLGCSYAEAAQVCECPVGTIRSRVARARDDLDAMLAEPAERPRSAGGHGQA
jgi:hypothetical protein